MKVLHWLDDNFEKSICIVLILTMTFLIFVQVVMRKVFNSSLSWSEELARYIFVWLICIGISYGCKLMRHIKIEAALKLFPKVTRRWVIILGEVLFLAFAIYIAYTGIKLAGYQVKLNKNSAALGLPLVYVNAAPAVGFGLAAFRPVQAIIWHLKNPPTDDATVADDALEGIL